VRGPLPGEIVFIREYSGAQNVNELVNEKRKFGQNSQLSSTVRFCLLLYFPFDLALFSFFSI